MLGLAGCGGGGGSSSSASSSSTVSSTAASAQTSGGPSSTDVGYVGQRYDCFAYQAITKVELYLDSYQFEPGNTYDVGYRGSGKTGLSTVFGHGTYRVQGNEIISTSGFLSNLHWHLVVEAADIAPARDSDGAFLGVGCYDFAKPPPPPPPARTGPGVFPAGTYLCYYTMENSPGEYSTSEPSTLVFFTDGTYWRLGSVRMQGWHQDGSRIVFTAGILWQIYSHDTGTYYPGGVALPHASGALASDRFTLVIRDTLVEGGVPPSREFVDNDGLDGSSSIPQSFLYCRASVG